MLRFSWLAAGFVSFALFGLPALLIWLGLTAAAFIFLLGLASGHRQALEQVEALAAEQEESAVDLHLHGDLADRKHAKQGSQ